MEIAASTVSSSPRLARDGQSASPQAQKGARVADLDSVAMAHALRLLTLDMISAGRCSHIGSVYSCTDIVAVLFARILRLDPQDVSSPDRDLFLLSKGHSGAAIYAALALTGVLPKSQLETYGKNGSVLSGHVSHKGVPGVEFSTGSLGHGLSVATGMAIAAKWSRHPRHVYTLLSDGECDEGSNWEAFLFGAHHKLDNLTAIIDYNKLQSLKSIADTLALEPLVDKLQAFGWNVIEVPGHDHAALEVAMSSERIVTGKPRVVIAHTTKGKGVSFMENSVLWHYRTPVGDEYAAAKAELLRSRPSST